MFGSKEKLELTERKRKQHRPSQVKEYEDDHLDQEIYNQYTS